MRTETVPVGDEVVLNIVMYTDVELLDEFVVTGFVRQRRQSIVSAIETIDPRELRVPASNLTTAIAGRVAGVIGFQPSGEPGADNAQFFIRGVTTFGYASNPLILLDGFEVSTDVLARIDPDAIASFSVLKDATAVALYGARGANGVIVVTTRRGEAGAPRISARIETRMSQPTQIQRTVDGVTFMRYFNQAQFNDNPLLPPRYSAQRIQNTIDNLNPYAFPDINWYDSMFRSHAMNQHVNFNVSGGGTMVRYFLSLSYNREEGILRNHGINDFGNNIVINRYNLLTNITMDLTQTTTLDFNMNSIFEDHAGPLDYTHYIFRSVVWTNPVEFPKYFAPDAANINTTHTLFGTDPEMRMINPFAQMVRGYRTGNIGRITSQFALEQDLGIVTEGLRARARVSINNDSHFTSRRSFDPYYYVVRTFDEFTNTYELQQVHRGSTALGDPATSRSGRFRTYVEGGLTYNRRFNEAHDVSALLIYNHETIQNTGGYTLLSQILPERSQAIRGRINYGFRDRYIVEASLTYTGSEKFAREHRWGLFPAMGASYII
jgi:TonB-linked SusC/RagA family outer membrane protein